MNIYLYICLSSFVLAILTTRVVIWLAGRIGAVDRPGIRTVHERSIPRIGGVAIFISTMTLVITVIFLNNAISGAFRSMQVQLTMLLSSATLVFVIGLVDDLKGLSARTKFLLELLIATVLCFGGLRISEITLTDGWTLPLGRWGYALTTLWIVGITNAVNLSDGLDGLAAGICSIACGVIALLAFLSGSMVIGVFMLALLGSLCGFLVFNFHPAKVFMGDCGSLFLGFIIATSSVMCTTKPAALVGLALPALALGVPIFDTLFSMLRRFLKHRSIFTPDRNHFHHRLLELGLNQRRAVLFTYLVTLLATGLGLLLMLASNDIHSVFVLGGMSLLIIFVFCVTGIVHLHGKLSHLPKTYVTSLEEQNGRGEFENQQLKFRQIRDENQWWKAVCQTASQMGFTWITLRTRAADGHIKEEHWRLPGPPPDPSYMVIIRVPLRSATPGRIVDLELAIARKGSLETTSRRATLFARLLDENEMQLTTTVNS